MKLKDLLAVRRSSRRRRRPREQAPREIVPASRPGDPFDAARERLKASIPPRQD